MEPHPHPLPFLLFLLLLTTTTGGLTFSPPSTTTSTLDPKQIRALQSLNIPTSKDPCSQPPNSTTICDSSTPFRHLLSLRLINCSDDLEISTTALTTLSTLTSLSFINCPITPPSHFPPLLSSNLHSFSSINSLKQLTGVFLGRFKNLTDLTLTGINIKASGPTIILGPMKSLQSITISNTNLHGFLPKHWHLNLTHIDLSANNLTGKIPSSITELENLKSLNLSKNSLNGEIPTSFGNLLFLENMSLASNSLSGPIPNSISEISDLLHLDLGSNQLNGTVPKFISEMKNLKFLNLEKNNFHGIMPFNGSFIKRLVVFKIGGNSDLCYNHTSISKKLKLGIAHCDKHGLPVSPPPAKDSSSDDSSSESSNYEDDSDGEDSDRNRDDHHGPSKVVIGVAVGLSSIVFLVLFFICLSKCCRR